MNPETRSPKPSVAKAFFAAFLALVTALGIVFVAVTAVWLSILSGVWAVAPAAVWVDNRSGSDAVVFVTDNSTSPESWFVVPANSAAHLGSAGLGRSPSPDIRVNILGWRHEEMHVSACSPGDYQDTLYDVPEGASVRLLIEASGEPSVSITPEPANLPTIAESPMTGAGLCAEL